MAGFAGLTVEIETSSKYTCGLPVFALAESKIPRLPDASVVPEAVSICQELKIVVLPGVPPALKVAVGEGLGTYA